MGGNFGWANVVAGKNTDGRLEVFAVGADGQMYNKWQLAPNGGWSSGWASLGGSLNPDDSRHLHQRRRPP